MDKVTKEYLKAEFYEVRNNSHGTAWNVGVSVRRVSPWNSKGFACFTVANGEGGPAIHAHMTEVGLATEEACH